MPQTVVMAGNSSVSAGAIRLRNRSTGATVATATATKLSDNLFSADFSGISASTYLVELVNQATGTVDWVDAVAIDTPDAIYYSTEVSVPSTGGGGGSFPSVAPNNWIVPASIQSGALNDKGNWAKAGDAMALTPAERTTLATAIEGAMLNDADGQALLAAINSSVQSLFDSGADVPVTTLVNLIAAQVWSVAGRTLSTSPPTASDIATAVWSAVGRTLTTADWAKAGDAMSLTPAERTTLTASIEGAMLNDTDGRALLAAINSSVQSLFDSGADVPVSTLVNLISTQVWSVAGRTLSTSPPTASDIATAVWANISRTLTTSAPPTAADIRTELDANATFASKVSAIDAVLAAMVEVVTGVTRFKAAALSQAPSAAGAWTLEQVTYALDQLALLTVAGGGVVVPMGSYMCARVDVERVFGSENVASWADLNNNQVAGEIDARINYCIQIADSEMRAALASSQWVMPVEGDTLPALLVHYVAVKAGVLLYEGRPVVDDMADGAGAHQLATHKRDVGRFIQGVLLNAISLEPLVSQINSAAPNVV